MMSSALDLVFPKRLYCTVCDSLIDDENEYGICFKCEPYFRDFVTVHESPEEIKPAYTELLSCFAYDGAVKAMVRNFKYHNAPYIADEIGDMMTKRLSDYLFENADSSTGELPSIDILTTVPMSEKKQLQRGYNQADLLAKRMASRLDVPYITDILVRNLHTSRPMSARGKTDRLMAIEGMYSINPKATDISGKTILLVDDVCTTGSTVEVCSEELQKMNPSKIFVITFAIGADLLYNNK